MSRVRRVSTSAREPVGWGEHTAVILAGGAARRLGGVAKPLLRVGAESLLAEAVGAARTAGCAEVLVVGPPDPDTTGVRWVREDGPRRGPAAALLAALALVTTSWVLVLAADVPCIRGALALLSDARSENGVDEAGGPAVDGVVLVDGHGRRQTLLARYRTSALRDAAARLGDPAGASLRRLLEGLRLGEVPDAENLSADVDTWEDYWTARMRRPTREGDRMPADDSRTLPPEALDAWTAALADRCGLDVQDVPTALILDLARDVAHGVARPAAPLSAFVAGLVAGRAGGAPEDVAAAVSAVTDLARTWRGDA